MRRTLKIKTRLMLIAAAVAILLTAAAGVALWSGRGVRQQLQQTMREDVQTAAAATQLAARVSDVGRRAHLVLVSAGTPAGDEDLVQWKRATGTAGSVISGLEATQAGAAAAPRLRAALLEYERGFGATVAAALALEPAARDEALARSPAGAAFARLQRETDDLVARSAAAVASTAAALESRVADSSWQVAVILAAGLAGFLALVLFFVYRPIASEAVTLAQVCDSLNRGDLSSRVPNPSGTELGAIGRSLNMMLDNTVSLIQSRAERDQMQAAVMKLLEEISGVAEGDLTVEAEVTTDVTGAVADSFNFMIAELRRIIGQVQNASQQVSTALADLRSITGELATGSEEQAAQAVEASVAIEEMAASIHYVSENAAVSASVAEEARTNAEHGARAVTRTIEGMKAIRDQVQETAKRIKRLGESSQEIAEIVELIGDIADRTSILALNASIQAAMAGEAGRGFAVVADEVERLAERATEATKRAGMLVKTTQSETSEVMAAMEDTTREVINRSNIANEAGVALTEIQGVSNRLAELIQAISDAAQQQARGSEQVAKSMNEMSSVTRNTASNTKQTAAAINSLALLADNLMASVARFKLPAAESPNPQVGVPRLVASR